MIILGIDPGTATTGYGVIKVPDDILSREYDYDIELLNYGNISTPKDMIMPRRLLHIYDSLNHIIEKYQPNLMSCELLFFGANRTSVMTVGQARGVVMLSAARHNIPFHEYTSMQVKLLVGGSGKCDKKQVHEAVRKWLGDNGIKRNPLKAPKGGHLDDATDAIAIAICHVLKLAAK